MRRFNTVRTRIHGPRRRHFTDYTRVIERIDKMEASMQGQIDQITQQLGQTQTDLQNAHQTLQQEIDNLAQANPQADLTGLRAAASALESSAQSLSAIAPSPPNPQPTPDPNPPAPQPAATAEDPEDRDSSE